MQLGEGDKLGTVGGLQDVEPGATEGRRRERCAASSSSSATIAMDDDGGGGARSWRALYAPGGVEHSLSVTVTRHEPGESAPTSSLPSCARTTSRAIGTESPRPLLALEGSNRRGTGSESPGPSSQTTMRTSSGVGRGYAAPGPRCVQTESHCPRSRRRPRRSHAASASAQHASCPAETVTWMPRRCLQSFGFPHPLFHEQAKVRRPKHPLRAAGLELRSSLQPASDAQHPKNPRRAMEKRAKVLGPRPKSGLDLVERP